MNDIKEKQSDDRNAFDTATDRHSVCSIRFDMVMAQTMDGMERTRPIQIEAQEEFEIMLSNWIHD